ncbi:MAG: hypothetical protein Q8N76_00470 [Candidatus Omnitrophota bacterium]|nr:hypothetical protein [Candidatus Omnitrophota bacterium]
MFDLNHLLLSPEYRAQGYSIEEVEEANDPLLILRCQGKEIARVSRTGVTISSILKIMTQEVSKN